MGKRSKKRTAATIAVGVAATIRAVILNWPPGAPGFTGPYSMIDYDRDGDIDGVDFGVFESCYNRTNRPYRCYYGLGILADIDQDGDVDGADFAFFSSCFNGAGQRYRRDTCNSPTHRQYTVTGYVRDKNGKGVEGVRMILTPPAPAI